MKKYIALDKSFQNIFVIDESDKTVFNIGDQVLILSDFSSSEEIHPFNLTKMKPSIEYIIDIGKLNYYLSNHKDDEFGNLKLHIDWKYIFKVKKIDYNISLKVLEFYNKNGFPPVPDDYLLPVYSGFNEYMKFHYDHYGFYQEGKFLDYLKNTFNFIKK